MKKRFLPALLLASIPAYAQSPSEVLMFFFEEGTPVEGLTVMIDGKPYRSGSIGSLALRLAPGEHRLVVKREHDQILSMALATLQDENLQMIVTLLDGQPPQVDIQSSAGKKSVQLEERKTAGEPGVLRGRVVSSEHGEPIAGARLFISGVAADARTDADGRFELKLPPGDYAVSILHPKFSTQNLNGVHVASKQTTEREVVLTPTGLELAEFVVLAPYIEGSVASVVAQQRESAAVSEVLGAEQMSKSGDSNAAAALKRTTGLTVEDGKYIVVRGQPSRYTMTLWNGSELPSPDPVRRVVPLDLFPTGVLSGIQVQKSYSVDKPGGFGGGLIDLTTRAIPESGFAQVSVSTGMNTQSTGERGLTHEGGDTDYLGKDDGTRAIPDAVAEAIEANRSLNDLPEEERNELGKLFPNNYRVSSRELPADEGLAVKGGKSFKTSAGEFGLLGSISWGRKYRLSKEVDRDFSLGVDNQVEILNEFEETRSDMDVNLGGLLVAGGKWKNHEVTSNTFFIRDTTQRTEITEGQDNTSDGRYERNFLLEWNEREMLVEQLVGKHELGVATFDWRLLTAEGSRYSPDRRTYTYVRVPTGDFVFYEESGAQRRYNTVEDQVDSVGLDLTFPVVASNSFAAKLKTGAATFRQDRNSDTQRFRFEPEGVDITSENPEDILDPDNIGNGLGFWDDTQSNDDYVGSAEVNGYYLMTDMDFRKSLRIVAGVRQEAADFEVKTFSSSSSGSEPIIGSFSQEELLPALSATWFMNNTMQLRAGYSTTVSRPELIELSNTLFFDPDSNESFVGNPELEPAVIDSFDMRWEWYPSTQESFSIGLFQRDYTDPIEQTFVPVAGGGQRTTFRNADGATVTGAEVGGRIGMSWIGDGFYLQGNYTLMESEVNLENDPIATSASRPLQGQADYVFNLQLGYDGERHNWAVSFNEVGRRLDKAGVQGLPDVYREPVPTLDANWSWRFAKNYEFKLGATNLLDPKVEYTADGLTERSSRKGTNIGLTLSWKG